MLVYISEPIMLRKNFLAIYHITLALQRALSLCFDTTLSLQAIAMIFWHFAHQSGPPKILWVFFYTTHTLQASLDNVVIELW